MSIATSKPGVVNKAVEGEQAMVDFGRALGLAAQSAPRALLFLQGELGMGKTTLSRGFLQAFGHQGAVKSPTYTLVEPYELAGRHLYHFDLYRLGDPEELEYMGIRDYFSEDSLCLVEWPQRAEGFLPTADIVVSISISVKGRAVQLCAQTATGEDIIGRLKD